ncbi:dTMP kinase [Hwanghaeella grinnelliae]|uniref:Thymidylate kinase n=1 Tax=Hwanghaeella grinnelliae TaxID=2500179 RepID=A0A437QN90_9PROT|nr:dTMP kinase [Hwanghaeella grinnelliae]RVU35998.1 dTMP kinase [Hwanghaeella grinnelliae]
MPFISIEGIDGSGKTLQSRLLAAALRKIDIKVIETKEPDRGSIGAEIRSILVTDRTAKLSPLEELLLISAARVSHLDGVIRPALDASEWVVCDRFLDSTYAFQVHKTDVPERLYKEISSVVVGQTMPDLTFILDIDPVTALERRSQRGEAADRDPSEATRDFSRIREGLLVVAKRYPERCRVIDAKRPASEVADLILFELKRSTLL